MSDAAAPLKTSPSTQWWVQVRGQAYGPYSIEQLARFVEEGRIRPATLVSNSPETGWTEARRVTALMAPLRGGEPANDAAEAANVFVHAEIVSGSWNAFMAALPLEAPALATAVSRDGHWAAAGDFDGLIHLYDLSGGARTNRITAHRGLINVTML